MKDQIIQDCYECKVCDDLAMHILYCMRYNPLYEAEDSEALRYAGATLISNMRKEI